MADPEIAAVEAANSRFYNAFETGDLDLMHEVWAGGAFAEGVSCVHPGSPMLRGRDEVLRSWALVMANTPYIQFVLTEVHTEVRGDHAVLTCEENILMADDSENGFLAGGSVVSTNLFVKEEGEWRLWVHHGSPVLGGVEEDDDGQD
ncbi:nuclear transport factor 2 family protein [Actinocorallia longicatena]|uniref:Nuclear transport factor 2 family protein n=1 Tax=Actinocorallia longicatena TaxID=111803 RepID=A0ABP6QPW9_9ACTN